MYQQMQKYGMVLEYCLQGIDEDRSVHFSGQFKEKKACIKSMKRKRHSVCITSTSYPLKVLDPQPIRSGEAQLKGQKISERNEI